MKTIPRFALCLALSFIIGLVSAYAFNLAIPHEKVHIAMGSAFSVALGVLVVELNKHNGRRLTFWFVMSGPYACGAFITGWFQFTAATVLSFIIPVFIMMVVKAPRRTESSGQ